MGITFPLTRPTMGIAIIEAFESAANFDVSPVEKWVSYRYPTKEFDYAHGQVLPRYRVYATPVTLQNRGFWRKNYEWHAKTWGGDLERFGTQIILEPFRQQARHAEFMISLVHIAPSCRTASGEEFVRIVRDPADESYAEYRPYFTKIVQGMIEALG